MFSFRTISMYFRVYVLTELMLGNFFRKFIYLFPWPTLAVVKCFPVRLPDQMKVFMKNRWRPPTDLGTVLSRLRGWQWQADFRGIASLFPLHEPLLCCLTLSLSRVEVISMYADSILIHCLFACLLKCPMESSFTSRYYFILLMSKKSLTSR